MHTGTRSPRSTGGLHTGRQTNDDARRRKDAECPPVRAQSRRRRSMGYGDTRGSPPRQRGGLLVPPMRAWLTQPHCHHRKAPPQPCALTTRNRPKVRLKAVQPQISITRKKVQILLIKLRATVRTNKESENTSQWQREPKHTFLHWRRTRKCGPKKVPLKSTGKQQKVIIVTFCHNLEFVNSDPYLCPTKTVNFPSP